MLLLAVNCSSELNKKNKIKYQSNLNDDKLMPNYNVSFGQLISQLKVYQMHN